MQALSDPYFHGLANVDREPSTQPISKLEFEFERRKLTKDDVRELIYREVWPYKSIPIALENCGLYSLLLFTIINLVFCNRFWSIIPRCCRSISEVEIKRADLCILGKEALFDIFDDFIILNFTSMHAEGFS